MGSGFIQQQDRGFAEQCPGNGEALRLSFGKTAAAFLDLTVDAVRQLFHKVPGEAETCLIRFIALQLFIAYVLTFLFNAL